MLQIIPLPVIIRMQFGSALISTQNPVFNGMEHHMLQIIRQFKSMKFYTNNSPS